MRIKNTTRCAARTTFFALSLLFAGVGTAYSQADPTVYVGDIKTQLTVEWPDNRTINLVFHGHSVPTGYFRTPDVRTLDAYPHQLLRRLKEKYPYAVVNVITTSIGGENAEQGAKRFAKDVLTHQPDILFIDYALNDRHIGVVRARKATEKMVKKALRKGIKVILVTPSPDIAADWWDPESELAAHNAMLHQLAARYHVGIADVYARFNTLVDDGKDVSRYMSQSNHPNEQGHRVIASELLKFFE